MNEHPQNFIDNAAKQLKELFVRIDALTQEHLDTTNADHRLLAFRAACEAKKFLSSGDKVNAPFYAQGRIALGFHHVKRLENNLISSKSL